VFPVFLVFPVFQGTGHPPRYRFLSDLAAQRPGFKTGSPVFATFLDET
jgi:hypothetical protein